MAQTTTSLAAGAYALERTGSASWASLTVALGVLPYVALSGLAGLVADLFPRSTVLAWSCGLRAVLIAASAGVMLLGGPVGLLVVLAVLSAVAATPAYPSLAASVPQCVPDEGLERWNAVATGVENLAWLVGPGMFGAADGPRLSAGRGGFDRGRRLRGRGRPRARRTAAATGGPR